MKFKELLLGSKKVQRQIKSNSGIYLLEIYAKENFKININKFSGLIFKKGFYYYAGSAQKNLVSRLDRHLKDNKKNHWHIDYLTTNKACKINTIYIFENAPKEFECQLVYELQKYFPVIFPASGFGNSDCSNCNSHLLFNTKAINYNQLFSRYQFIVRLIPSLNETS